MKYLIWGAGNRGKRYSWVFKNDELIAFVDNDPNKIGRTYEGKPVISFDEYLAEYKDAFIVIGMVFEEHQVRCLESKGIFNYLLFSECPGEFQVYCPQTYLRDYVRTIIKKYADYVIYGGSLYAIKLNELIHEMTGRYAPIMINRNMPRERARAFINTVNGEMPVIEFNEKFSADHVLAASEDDLDHLKAVAGNDCQIINVFDCSDRIEAYHNYKIEKYKNLHKGATCFIVANGPSLRMEDVKLLHDNNIICFGMNSIWRAFSMTSWRPTYYLLEDPVGFEEKYDGKFMRMEKQGIKMMFLGDSNGEYWGSGNKPKGDYLINHLHLEFSEFRHPKFSDDFSRRTYEGGTVTYSCMELAAYMGFTKIYLLGVDNTESSTYGHFYDKDNPIDPPIGTDNFLRLGYQTARKYANEHGIHICNATRGGRLEVFDRVDFDSLFTDGKFTPEKAVIHPRKPWYEDMATGEK